MIERPFWANRLRRAWDRAPIVWLAGPRRTGKTTLAKLVPDSAYLNCDLPRTADLLQDPEDFFGSVQAPIVVLDEVHQLPDPSRVLKVAADEFSHLKVLATGSSSLAATRKFRDSLTGRKRSVLLKPVLFEELDAFHVKDLRTRLFRGGLPQALLTDEIDDEFYGEWLDSYFSRDVQELFGVEKRAGFLALLELLFRQSGGLCEATALARHVSLSRPTIVNYLNIYEMTNVVAVLRPFHKGSLRELTHRPKVYGFDTGFVRYARGWDSIRDEDAGLLWEHLVLDTLASHLPERKIQFWRDTDHREIDFVVPAPGGGADAVECKWNPSHFEPRNLRAFRASEPRGRNFLVSPRIKDAVTRHYQDLEVRLVPLEVLPRLMGSTLSPRRSP